MEEEEQPRHQEKTCEHPDHPDGTANFIRRQGQNPQVRQETHMPHPGKGDSQKDGRQTVNGGFALCPGIHQTHRVGMFRSGIAGGLFLHRHPRLLTPVDEEPRRSVSLAQPGGETNAPALSFTIII